MNGLGGSTNRRRRRPRMVQLANAGVETAGTIWTRPRPRSLSNMVAKGRGANLSTMEPRASFPNNRPARAVHGHQSRNFNGFRLDGPERRGPRAPAPEHEIWSCFSRFVEFNRTANPTNSVCVIDNHGNLHLYRSSTPEVPVEPWEDRGHSAFGRFDARRLQAGADQSAHGRDVPGDGARMPLTRRGKIIDPHGGGLHRTDPVTAGGSPIQANAFQNLIVTAMFCIVRTDASSFHGGRDDRPISPGHGGSPTAPRRAGQWEIDHPRRSVPTSVGARRAADRLGVEKPNIYQLRAIAVLCSRWRAGARGLPLTPVMQEFLWMPSTAAGKGRP